MGPFLAYCLQPALDFSVSVNEAMVVVGLVGYVSRPWDAGEYETYEGLRILDVISCADRQRRDGKVTNGSEPAWRTKDGLTGMRKQ
jgi:hypothetical protein